jgi:hypothetical protein
MSGARKKRRLRRNLHPRIAQRVLQDPRQDRRKKRIKINLGTTDLAEVCFPLKPGRGYPCPRPLASPGGGVQPCFGEIDVVLDSAEDLVVDHMFVAQLKDHLAFDLKRLPGEPFVLFGKDAFGLVFVV